VLRLQATDWMSGGAGIDIGIITPTSPGRLPAVARRPGEPGQQPVRLRGRIRRPACRRTPRSRTPHERRCRWWPRQRAAARTPRAARN